MYVGLDIGEAGSGTSACAYWPVTGALKTWLAFGDRPTLKERAKRDGADYPDMERRGELPAKVEQVKAQGLRQGWACDCRGPVYVGLDIGEAGSGTSACAYWPVTGALKTWLAFGDRPTLKERAKRDGADYPDMERRGELPAKVEQVKADPPD